MTVTWVASAVMQLVSSLGLCGHLCVCTAQITAYLQACCSRNHLSPQKCCRAELGKLCSPRVSLHSPLQAGRRCSNLHVLLSVGLQWSDSPPRKFTTKHHDTVSQKKRCSGLENTSTGNKISFFFFFFNSWLYWELGLKSSFSLLSEESPSGTL